MTRPFEVMVADAHPLTRESICEALAASHHVDVIGDVGRGADLLAGLKMLDPDVVLLDFDLPDMDGLACLSLLCANHPQVKVVMVVAERDPDRIDRALRAGAVACVLKSVEPADIASAVRQAIDGTVYTAIAAPEPVDRADEVGLTERERTMLSALARGLSNKAIGQELWVTEQTVKFHLNNLYRKLGVPNRTAAARFAYEHDLVGSS